MSPLLEQQQHFAQLIALWMRAAYARGFSVTFGDAFRDQRCPYGAEGSYHKRRLAVDFNLFKDGRYLTSVEEWRELGEAWKILDPLCTWGGDFKTGAVGDANHLSYGEGKRNG
ncbi:M15 family peptidase [Gammaproteobacteria bacterium]